MKRLIATVAWLLVLVSPGLCADPIVGTWRIESFVREVTATGQRYSEFGDKPGGFISYLPDGRMHAMLVADNRAKPAGPVPTDTEKAALFGTMIAYAGTYRIDGDKVIHDVEASWNQLWTGSKQVRFFKAEGDTLTIATAVARSPRDGQDGRTIVVFKKVH
jgi:lipocalin-like protein